MERRKWRQTLLQIDVHIWAGPPIDAREAGVVAARAAREAATFALINAWAAEDAEEEAANYNEQVAISAEGPPR